MGKRKQKSRQARMRNRRASITSENPRKQRGLKSAKTDQHGTGDIVRRSNSHSPQYAWVTVEHRDSDGNPTFPKELIESTYQRRYNEVPSDSAIRVHVLAGYKPNPLMMVERKIYEIHRISIEGWRRKGQITVEIEGWRNHESDWFTAMRGAKLEISDPGLPGPHNEKSNFVVSQSSFSRKIVKFVAENGGRTESRLFEGKLDIIEIWRSAWRRQWVDILSFGIKLLIVPLLVALGAGLTLLWVGRTANSGGNDSSTQGSPSVDGSRVRTGPLWSEPANVSESHPSSDVPETQTHSETQHLSNGTQSLDGGDKRSGDNDEIRGEDNSE